MLSLSYFIRRFPSIFRVEYEVGNWPSTGSMSSRNSEIRVLLSHTSVDQTYSCQSEAGRFHKPPLTSLTTASQSETTVDQTYSCQSEFGVLYYWKLRPDFGVTGYSSASQDSNFWGNVYIQLYCRSLQSKFRRAEKPLLGRKPQCQHSSEIA